MSNSVKSLYKSVTSTSQVISVDLSSAYTNATDVAIIEAGSTSLSIGDSVSVDIGYTDNHAQLFTGYVKSIERAYPHNTYTITAYDVMTRAVDYFIASSNPSNPFKRSNIKAEDLIEDLLALAGLTNYQGDNTFFTYGVSVPVEVNLVGCYDFCKQLSDLVAWHLYADKNGKVWFVDRKPYPVGGDSSSGTIASTAVLGATLAQSDDDIRNRIVVYGANNISAEAKASSPYLPSGFYKTAVMSASFVDSQSVANDAASYNLAKWNRLRSSLIMSLVGDPSIVARNIYTMATLPIVASDDWFAYSVNHSLTSSGYKTNVEFRK
jgi:hypothetical protein